MPKKTDTPAAPAAAVTAPPVTPDDAPGAEEATPAAPADESAPAEEVYSDDESAVADFEDGTDFVTAVWYGSPGSGKTTNMCAFLLAEREGRLLVCNVEGGMKLRALKAQGIPTDRISVWPRPGIRPTFDGLERMVLKMQADLDEARASGAPRPWCGIGWDSVTELIKTMLDNVLEDQHAARREVAERARKAGKPAPRSSRARFVTESDDYQLVSQQVRSVLRKIRYMDLHFGVTALVRRDEDKNTGAVIYGPACPPALQGDLMSYSDVVIHTEVDDLGRFMGRVLGNPSWLAKDRYGLLPSELENPTAATLLDYITGRTKEEVVLPEDDTATAPVEEPAPAAPKSSTAKRSTRTTPKTTAPPAAPVAAGDDEPPF